MKTLIFSLALVSAAGLLASCSSLSGNHGADKSPSIETRDVSMAARGEDEAPRHRLFDFTVLR